MKNNHSINNSFDELSNIKESEILYRAIRDINLKIFNGNALDYSLLIDSNGLSVERDGGRTESELISSLLLRFKDFKTYAKIYAKDVYELNLYPVPKPSKNNKYHAEIWENKDQKPLSLSSSKKLFKRIKIINQESLYS